VEGGDGKRHGTHRCVEVRRSCWCVGGRVGREHERGREGGRQRGDQHEAQRGGGCSQLASLEAAAAEAALLSPCPPTTTTAAGRDRGLARGGCPAPPG
jgi:hypothetical protein